MVFAACIFPTSVMAQNEIIWESLGNTLDSDGNPSFIQRFIIKTETPVDGFAFCQLKMDKTPLNSADTLIEILPGYYYVASPRFASVGDSIVVDVLTSGALYQHLFFPDGMHFVKDGKTIPATTTRKRLTSFPEQWRIPKTGKDFMPYGDRAYAINDSIRSSYRATPYGQLPTLKNVKFTGGSANVNKLLATPFKITKIDDPRHDFWKGVVSSDGVEIITNSANPDNVASGLKRRLIESANASGDVPSAVIEDWSDFPYRGFMLDVARNFLPKEDVMTVIDLLSRYGLNSLHFHLGEDEGWRLEIPSLLELTEVGSRRGFTLTDDVPFLKGIYSGDGNPDSSTVANGYYTVDDYIEILRYADSKGVAVIPEFDTPGHSRAAIRAMEWRAKQTGDESLRLVHDGDTSKYSTAQDFNDNIMNPALDGPYKFWDIVFDDIINIYNKAGVPLLAVNIGGDEVAEHAWEGSDKARALMKEKGMTHQRDLHAYFVEKVNEIARNKGIKTMGWEEIATGHSPEYDAIVVPQTFGVNSWTLRGRNAKEMAEKGYPVILSNVDYLYFDQHYSGHPEEPGMWWGGIVDEFVPFHATLDVLLPGDTTIQNRVKGLSGQIFSETVRDFPMVQRLLLPRILGLAERSHNSHETINDDEYFGLLTEEMLRWQQEGLTFFLRQPGIIVEDGLIKMNEPYGFGEIRYTLDGSEPSTDSTLYTAPIPLGDTKEVRAKLYVGPSFSATSLLWP